MCIFLLNVGLFCCKMLIEYRTMAIFCSVGDLLLPLNSNMKGSILKQALDYSFSSLRCLGEVLPTPHPVT